MAAVAEDGLSVVFSSHVVSELERIADYLVVLNEGRLQLAGEVDVLLGAHRILTGPGGEMALDSKRIAVVQATQAGAQAHLLVRTSAADEPDPPGWLSSPPTLEDLVLAYLRDPKASVLPGPDLTAAAGGQAVRA
jgi:ABC-2 type transport system ATP-binding protein